MKFSPTDRFNVYKNYFSFASKQILIGIPAKDVQYKKGLKEKINLMAYAPLCVLPSIKDLLNRYKTATPEIQEEVKHIFQKLEKQNSIRPYVGYNITALVGFLIEFTHEGLTQIIEQPFIKDTFMDPILWRVQDWEKVEKAHKPELERERYIVCRSRIIDEIGKMRRRISISDDYQSKMNFLCASYLISPSILYSGRGTLYAICKPQNMDNSAWMQSSDRYLCKAKDALMSTDHGAQMDIREMLLESGIPASSIVEWEIRTYLRVLHIPPQKAKLINQLLSPFPCEEDE